MTIVVYVAHPVAPRADEVRAKLDRLAAFGIDREVMGHEVTAAAIVRDNCNRATEWVGWIVQHTDWVVLAPWIPIVIALGDDGGPLRERGLRDMERAVERCDAIALCGGRLTDGMSREYAAAVRARRGVIDLLSLGDRPPRWSSRRARYELAVRSRGHAIAPAGMQG